MKAIVYRRYGPPDVLQYEDIDKPAPGDDQVLVRIRAAAVNPYDWHFMRGSPSMVRLAGGFTKPKKIQLGVDGAGEVAAIGSRVTRFKPGDAVFGAFSSGSLAEFACTKERGLAIKPDGISFEEAAAIPIAALTALQSLRKGGLQPGQRVLVNGAAGGVGTYGVQLARALGAAVAGVCSTRNVEMVRSLGAERVFDYTREDFTKSGQRYDLILDCIGNHSASDLRRALTARGRCAMVGGSAGASSTRLMLDLMSRLLLSQFSKRKFVAALAKSNPDDLAFVAGLMKDGTIRSVIDRTYPLRDTAEAIRYLETGHARGKVLIVI